jgi:hypothetical protein
MSKPDAGPGGAGVSLNLKGLLLGAGERRAHPVR